MPQGPRVRGAFCSGIVTGFGLEAEMRRVLAHLLLSRFALPESDNAQVASFPVCRDRTCARPRTRARSDLATIARPRAAADLARCGPRRAVAPETGSGGSRRRAHVVGQGQRCQPADDDGICAHGPQQRYGGGGVSRWRLSGHGDGSGRHGDLPLADVARYHLRVAEVPRTEFGADLDQWRPLLSESADRAAARAAHAGAGAPACGGMGHRSAQGRRDRVFRRRAPGGRGQHAFRKAHVCGGGRCGCAKLPPGLRHRRLSRPPVGARR